MRKAGALLEEIAPGQDARTDTTSQTGLGSYAATIKQANMGEGVKLAACPLVPLARHPQEQNGDRCVRACEVAPEKPEEGAPCNGCGFCCAAGPCGLAVEFLGVTVGPCPAMEFEAGRFWCGLVRNPSSYLDMPAFGDPVVGAIFARAVGIGRGCDSDAPGTLALVEQARA